MDIWFGDPGEDLVPGLVHGRLHAGRHWSAQLEAFTAQGQQPGIGRWDLQSVGAQVQQLSRCALVAADGRAARAGLNALPLHRFALSGGGVDEQYAIAATQVVGVLHHQLLVAERGYVVWVGALQAW
ncbi:MAG: hypothetical protein KA203_11020, partial [Aquabacterium sp.]|nr:hypothetical protein [Aquabacterium sp.]